MPSFSAAFDPVGAPSLLLHRPIGITVTGHAGTTAALPGTGGQVMTSGVIQAMKGQRNVDDLLRAIPDAVRPLLVFDRLTLSLDRGAHGAPRRVVLEEDARPDLAAQRLQSACAAPLSAPQRTLGTLEIASRHAHAYSQEDARLLAAIAEEI